MSFDAKSKGKKGVIAEMNVVPLVDIMLVLLVIFMITAPLMFNGINMKLPKTKKVNRVSLTKNQIIISMDRAGDTFIGQDKFLLNELIKEVSSRLSGNPNQPVFLRADYGIHYGKVAKLISYLKRGGIANISLVTEVER